MKLHLTALSLLIWVASVAQTPYYKYPAYDEVVKKFYRSYSVKERLTDSYIKFEKRPDGWRIAFYSISRDGSKTFDGLFWSRQKARYLKLVLDEVKDKDENSEYINGIRDDSEKSLFMICPYYGYRGWDIDMIRDFKDDRNPADTLLYALGRAYSSYASNLLDDFSGLSERSVRFHLPPGKNSMSLGQLKEYRYNQHLAIEKFRLLEKRNPGFETFIGPIGLKADNEHLTSFLNIRMFQNEEEAKKEIREGLYSEFMLAFAKNLLNSCPQNAILFTNGDNDTYPVLYVQAQYGFRSDVMVVNLSLLNTARYTNSLRETVLDAPGLIFSYPPEEITPDNREYASIKETSDSAFDITLIPGYFRDDKNRIEDVSGKNNYYLPSHKFKFSEGENDMEWTVKAKYLMRNDLMVLDLIATAKWKRPLCFATTVGTDNFIDLEKYFELIGLVYLLTPHSANNSSFDDPFLSAVNSALMYDNMMHKFSWTWNRKPVSTENLIGINYRINFIRLVDALLDENKPDSAKAILELVDRAFPDPALPYGIHHIRIVRQYFRVGEYEKGARIAKQMLYNIDNGIAIQGGITAEKQKEYREYIVQELDRMIKEFKLEKLLKLNEN